MKNIVIPKRHHSAFKEKADIKVWLSENGASRGMPDSKLDALAEVWGAKILRKVPLPKKPATKVPSKKPFFDKVSDKLVKKGTSIE